MPLLLAWFDIILINLWGKNLFDDREGQAALAAMSLYLISFYALFCGALFFIIVSNTLPGVVFTTGMQSHNTRFVLPLPALGLAVLYSIYMALVFTVVRFGLLSMPHISDGFLYSWVTLALTAFSAVMMFFFVASFFKQNFPKFLLVVLTLLSIIFLGNFFFVLPEPLPKISPLYWTFKNLVAISDLGSDIIADPCWRLSDGLRQSLTEPDKVFYQCKCMGMALFSPDSCHFPGIGAYYRPELVLPPPVEPLPPGDPPAVPQPPKDPLDKQILEQYNQAVREYELLETSYQLRLEIYRAQYQSYLKELSHWNTTRATAVASAEQMISRMLARFGWSFSNYDDQAQYRISLLMGCLALAVYSIVFYILILLRRQKFSLPNESQNS